MAQVEIDETEYTNLRNIAGAMQKMLANPKTRSKVLEAQKLINPDAIIPELDATRPVFEKLDEVNAKVSELTKQLADEKTAAKDEKARAALEAQWEKSRVKAVQAGYTSEGIDALEKYMVEKGVVDHEVAMPSFEKMHPPETLIAHSADRFDVFSGLVPAGETDDVNLLLSGNDSQFLNKRIKDTLTSVRGR